LVSVADVAPQFIQAAVSKFIPGFGFATQIADIIGQAIAGPADPRSGFSGAAAIPEGIEFREAFGLEPGRSGIPVFNPFVDPTTGVGLPGIFRAFTSLTEGIGPTASGLAASQALSFAPSVASRGEAKLSSILAAPVVLPSFKGGAFSPFAQLFDEERFRARVATDRAAQIATSRGQQLDLARANPFFGAAASALALGLLPGGEVSAATAIGFGGQREPIARSIAALPGLSEPSTQEMIPMPEISTSGVSGGFGGFLGGLGEFIGAITPIAQTLIPALLPQPGRSPVFMPGGALPFGLPGFPQATRAGFELFPQGLDSLLGPSMLPQFLQPGGGAAVAAPGCIVPQVRTSMRLPSRVDVPNANGTFTTFKNMGRPILWTGDLAATKRVRKVARRAKRAGG